MLKCSYLVLLYGKKPSQSNTLETILSSQLRFDNCSITLWNNGPSSISNSLECIPKLEGLGFVVEVVETLENEAISKIYNEFISFRDSQKYVFLDDDSTLNDEYLSASLRLVDSEIGLPIIRSGSCISSPRENGIIRENIGLYEKEQEVMAIATGLVLGRNIIIEMLKKYNDVFDPRFYLYGVDTTFCFRINALKLAHKTRTIEGFEHSLSRLVAESKEASRFRRKERTYDTVLSSKFYFFPNNKLRHYKFMLRCALVYIYKIIFRKKQTIDILSLFRAIYSGKHYRDSENKLIERIY
ncbi:hypothetical protein R7Z42_10145 [Vibrio sp. 1863]|uniref:hypothetical protein n=1 Tax=Vibrio sp. 1863 TaxID=3074579 RepID=UPI0029656A4A|nr:hypothetical protein [Vibrio sp. 1863]MDW2075371.1 hypothetical protein [Vibrio sp. 1863]